MTPSATSSHLKGYQGQSPWLVSGRRLRQQPQTLVLEALESVTLKLTDPPSFDTFPKKCWHDLHDRTDLGHW
jgi:hypothetical protein